MKRDQIDFHIVEPQHADIHFRLENWGLWAKDRDPRLAKQDSSPMFRMTRSGHGDRAYGAPTVTAINSMDAQRVAKGVALLPEPHRIAVNWFYIKPVSPSKACRMLATNMGGLAEFVRSARQMLINRGV